MRIETDVKLDFKDVLIRPKRSTLNSRNAVDIHRDFRFFHTSSEWKGFPLIAANMDVTGTMAMARALGQMRRADGAAQALSRGPARRVLRRRGRRTCVLFARRHRARSRKARGGAQARAVAVSVHRCRQRLFRTVPRHRQARARRESELRHHGRQCRHRRHDGGAGARRRRHRQDRHRPGLGLHDAPRHRRRLSATLGDHRMRRRRAWAEGPGLRRRRLHLARRRRQGLWRRRRFRHARRHARRPRRMRRRNPLRGARRRAGSGRRWASTACRRRRR